MKSSHKLSDTSSSSPMSCQAMATNRHSDNLAIWSHITSSLLATWMNDKSCPNKVI